MSRSKSESSVDSFSSRRESFHSMYDESLGGGNNKLDARSNSSVERGHRGWSQHSSEVSDSSESTLSSGRARVKQTSSSSAREVEHQNSQQLPAQEPARHQNVGSDLHSLGECQPCAWSGKPSGCFNAASCVFCHMCPAGEIKARRKERQKLMKAELAKLREAADTAQPQRNSLPEEDREHAPMQPAREPGKVGKVQQFANMQAMVMGTTPGAQDLSNSRQQYPISPGRQHPTSPGRPKGRFLEGMVVPGRHAQPAAALASKPNTQFSKSSIRL